MYMGYVIITASLVFSAFHLFLLLLGIINLIDGLKTQESDQLNSKAILGIVHISILVGIWILSAIVYWTLRIHFIFIALASLFIGLSVGLIAYGAQYIVNQSRFERVTIKITAEGDRYLVYEDGREVPYSSTYNQVEGFRRGHSGSGSDWVCWRNGEVCYVRDDLKELLTKEPTRVGVGLVVIGAILLLLMLLLTMLVAFKFRDHIAVNRG
jgi:hypothetical protein